MYRALIIAVALCILCGLRAVAQDSGLPAPPKPPKSKAKEAEAAPEKGAGDKSPGPAADTDERGHRLRGGEMLRPRRLRIDVPFFHMDLDFGGRGRAVMPERESPSDISPKAQGEAAPAARADEIPAPGNRDDQKSR